MQMLVYLGMCCTATLDISAAAVTTAASAAVAAAVCFTE
jgi:hypothetical protein